MNKNEDKMDNKREELDLEMLEIDVQMARQNVEITKKADTQDIIRRNIETCVSVIKVSLAIGDSDLKKIASNKISELVPLLNSLLNS